MTFSESVLDTLQEVSDRWGFSDPVYYLDAGRLGGTMTYHGMDRRAFVMLEGLLSEAGIDPDGLIAYYSLEEVQPQ